ncbi:MAG: DUF3553 domain-containing protein [Phycisphaerales bacterium]
MLVKHWSFGDRLVHAGRPEWGVGVVTSAAGEQHEGKACQRLVIRFERAGMKTISTALADLRAPDEVPMLIAEPEKRDDPLAAGNAVSVKELMLRIPDDAKDPFATPRSRLAATMALYRFTGEGSSLLDWAAMQSGLKDPMTKFSRHELEELFRRFIQVRDEHLRRLAQELRKTEPGLLAEAQRTAPKFAQQVLRRLD